MWCAGAGGGQRTVRRSSSPLPAGQPPTNSLFSAFGSMPATILAAWQREPGRQRARSADVCVRVWSAADGSKEQAAAWSRQSQSRRRHLRALSAHSQPTPSPPALLQHNRDGLRRSESVRPSLPGAAQAGNWGRPTGTAGGRSFSHRAPLWPARSRRVEAERLAVAHSLRNWGSGF